MDHRHPHVFVRDEDHTGSVAARHRSPEAIMNKIHRRVRSLAIDQERLAKSRNELLSKREHVRILVKEVQVKRVEAGDAEAAFMTYIRNIVTSGSRDTSPQEQSTVLSDLHNRVEVARNDVGVLETDLLQYGRALTGAEIRFQEDETAFYQYDLPELFEQDISTVGPSDATTSLTIPPPPPPPPYPPQLHLQPLPSGSPPRAYIPPVHLDGQDYYPRPPPPPPPPASSYLPQFAVDHVHQRAQITKLSASNLPLMPVSVQSIENSEKDMQHTSIELDGLGKQFDPHHKAGISSSIRIDDTDSISLSSRSESPRSFTASTTSYLPAPSSVGQSDVETERTHVENASVNQSVSNKSRRCSDPTNYDRSSLLVPQLLGRSLSENAILDSSKPRKKYRIREWLLTLLRQSKIEKTLYQNILEDTLIEKGYHYPDDESWVVPAETYWSQDSRSSFEAPVLPSESESSASDIDYQSMENVESIIDAPRRRRSMRIRPSMNNTGSERLRAGIDISSEDEMDDPAFFPLPRSSSVTVTSVKSEDASMDDACYFPLPPSPASTAMDSESPKASFHTEHPYAASPTTLPVAIPSEPVLPGHSGAVGTRPHGEACAATPDVMTVVPRTDTRHHTDSGLGMGWCIQS